MTLAVAACFPWGRLKDVRDSLPPGNRPEQGVILATDSRFTLASAFMDRGRKLYQITPDAGLVYAGDVLAAQRAIRALRRYLRRRRTEEPIDPTEPAGRILRAAYQEERARASAGRRVSVKPLQILVGVCTPSGQAWITRFTSQSDFQPLYLLGVEALGWRNDIETFKKTLIENEREQWEKQSVDLDPQKGIFGIVSSMRAALISPDRSPGIGGRVQCLTITKDGASELTLSVLNEGGDPLVEAAWSTVTTPLSDVRPFSARVGPYSVTSDMEFVYAHVSD